MWLGDFRRKLLTDTKRLGRWGESRCEKYLRRKGLRRIGRNFACRSGEIDLIMASNDGVIVFVEVKTRADESFVKVESAVTPAKRARIVRTAKYFVKSYKIKDKPLRFDVVCVILGHKGKPEIRHYENAFRA